MHILVNTNANVNKHYAFIKPNLCITMTPVSETIAIC